MKTTHRRIVVVASSVALSGAAVLAACGFPSPVLLDLSELDGAAAGDALDATDSTDAFVTPPSTDGATVSDAGPERIDAAGCTTCDCDHDGYFTRNRPGCADASVGDGGEDEDCEDDYPDIHPHQTDYSLAANPPRGGDRNCDNQAERLYKSVNISCASFLDATCSKREGYTSDPKCGEAAAWVKCIGSILGCSVDEKNIQYPIQGCR